MNVSNCDNIHPCSRTTAEYHFYLSVNEEIEPQIYLLFDWVSALFLDRVGSCFRPLSIVCYDGHRKRIRFTSVPNLVIKLISSGITLAQVRSKNVEITPDKLTMKIKVVFKCLLMCLFVDTSTHKFWIL